MLLAAARDLGVTPRQTWMVGDKVSDVVAGEHFGCWTIWVAGARWKRRFEAEAGFMSHLSAKYAARDGIQALLAL